MKMPREKETQCIKDFINIYHSESCLWKIKLKEYHDKHKKDAAYELLVEKLKEIDSTATRTSVVKKINNIRSSYRKKLKKVNESMRTRSEADEVYQPKLWYFKMLNFLTGRDIPRNLRSNHENKDENIETEIRKIVKVHTSDTANSNEPIIPLPSSSKTAEASRRSQTQQSTCNQATLTNEVLLTVNDYFKQPQIKDDRYDIFGKNIAMKLRYVSNPQRILAEKLINDVLFEAEMESLTTSH